MGSTVQQVIRDLLQVREGLTLEVSNINAALKALGYFEPAKNQQPIFITDNKQGTVVERVTAILKVEGHFMSRRQIEEYAAKNGMPFSGDVKATISSAKRDGKLSMITGKANIGLWGLPEWVDENGAKTEYLIPQSHLKVANG